MNQGGRWSSDVIHGIAQSVRYKRKKTGKVDTEELTTEGKLVRRQKAPAVGGVPGNRRPEDRSHMATWCHRLQR